MRENGGMRLFVGNLPFATTEDYLREFFEESGQVVEDLMIVKDKNTGRSRGFAFITLADSGDIKKVTARFDGQSFMDSGSPSTKPWSGSRPAGKTHQPGRGNVSPFAS